MTTHNDRALAAQQLADTVMVNFLEKHPELLGVEDCELSYDDPSGLFFFHYFTEDGSTVTINSDGTIALLLEDVT